MRRAGRSLAVGALLAVSLLAWGSIRASAATQLSSPAVGRQVRAAVAVLKLGSRGAAVTALQRKLVRLTYLPAGAADGVFGPRTRHAVVAFQGWSGLVRDGIVGPRTSGALARARKPVPWSYATGIEIHLRQQVLLLISQRRVVRAIHVSTGKAGTPTPGGHFRIYSRQTMSWSVPFRVWMPLAQYFHAGYAIHEFSSVPDNPASHGCVRVPHQEAGAVWRFGRVGMRVWTRR